MRLGFSGDRLFFLIVLVLVVGGIAMFASASLGLLARADGAPWRLALTQLLLGLIPGTLGLLALRFAPPAWIQKMVVPVYLGAIILTLLVFVPGIGMTINGATRWIDIGFTTVQPGEFLKIGTILMLAWWLSRVKGKLTDLTKGLIPFGVIVGLPCLILLLQPNTSTVIIIGLTSVALYFLAGAPLRDLFLLALIAVVLAAGLVMARPYLLDRVKTFMDPSRDPLSSGYQIQQSLIAIGSGGLVGRGFGQSVQKFNYLPEAHGDSVFAVYGEEFGFVGTMLLLGLFVAFATRGFAIAAGAATLFGSLAATGLTLLISLAAFLNIGAMLAILPLTGLPLPFVSHGGTALFTALLCVGIILNVAAHRKRRT
ncbi:MAG TPA: putative lipid II flippase FtsW [Candidatus Paceibacterota bacterium]|nr:putative lipid II flippase FtsW [Candidatus Paceibacterota bacterium]